LSENLNNNDRFKCKEAYDGFYEKTDFKHFGLMDAIFIKSIVRRYRLRDLKLLDVGCGTGWYSYLFHSQGVNVYGIDLSETAIRKAKERGMPKSFLVGDGFFLPFSQDRFDAIFLSGFSPFNDLDLSNLTELGHSLLSLLKPDGILFFHKTTNLSGNKDSRMNHSINAYTHYFDSLEGVSVIECFAVSPISWGFMGGWALSSLSTKVIRTITKLTGIPLRVLIVNQKIRQFRG